MAEIPWKNAKNPPLICLVVPADGCGALDDVLAAIPASCRAAFAVVRQGGAENPAELRDSLAKHAALAARAAADGMAIDAGHIYVIPPEKTISVEAGRFAAARPGPGATDNPADFFLHSLAAAYGERGIGIILSGAGGEGLAGLRALKAAGGLVLAQQPDEARPGAMPGEVIATAGPDFVVPLRDIPNILSHYLNLITTPPQTSGAALMPDSMPRLADFAALLGDASGRDLSLYKAETMQRRITRRLALHGLTAPAYLARLARDPREADALLKDLLINVTGFFRNPEVFAGLGPCLDDSLRTHDKKQPFRVWVPGCSTGEEAYSLAMLLVERSAAVGYSGALQIFASDIDDEALAIARAGLYPQRLRASVSAARLTRFFTEEAGQLRISTGLRGLVTFCRHDLLRDPPFSRLSLISCRNLLIYLVPAAQSRALAAFHFGLRETGLLLLGQAETATAAPALFTPLDDRLHLYRRREGHAVHPPQFEGTRLAPGRRAPLPPPQDAAQPAAQFPGRVQQLIVEKYAPAAAALNQERPAGDEAEGSTAIRLRRQLAATQRELTRVLHELRDAKEAMSVKTAEMTTLQEECLSANEELESSREELQSLNGELAAANTALQNSLHDAHRSTAALANLFNSTSVATIWLDATLTIKRFNPRMRDLCALIDSDTGRPLADLVPKFADPDLHHDVRVAATTGTPGEREIQSSSGAWFARAAVPYRSETGTIEGAVVTFTEITGVKQAALAAAAANRYAALLVNAAREPMAVLDGVLRIVAANRAFCQSFALAEADIGHSRLAALAPPLFTQDGLQDMLSRMLAQPAPEEARLELEARMPAQRLWSVLLRRVVPPSAPSALIVLALEDITSRRQIMRQHIQLLVDALPVASCVLDRDGRIRYVSPAMPALFGYSAETLLEGTINMLIPPELREQHQRAHMAFVAQPSRRAMAAAGGVYGMTSDGTRIPLDIGLSPIDTADGPLVIATIHDLRQIRETEAERDELRAALAEELEDMRELHELATRLVGNATLPDILEEILGAVIRLQHADFGHIQLYHPDSDTLTIAAQRHFPPAFLADSLREAEQDDTPYRRALREGRRVMIGDAEHDPAFPAHRAFALKAGFRALQATPIRAPNGTTKGVLATHFAHRHLPSERELRLTDLYLRLAAELIDHAETEAAVDAARRAAERANEMKTQFLSAAGHDLRQPLQTIGLLKAVLERQVINPQAFTTLAKLDDAAAHMQELVDSLLDASQIESGAVRVALETIALTPLFDRMTSDLAPVAEARGLQLRYVPCSFSIHSDRRLLMRILGNLLSNAIKYTDVGKILLGCRRHGEDLRVEVWDTGVGIAAENISAIFGEFRRGRHDETERAGLGLGLYIVQRFTEQLGYRIEVRSVPGKGSLFAMVIPGPFIVPPVAAQHAPDEAEPPVVLVVAGNADQREAMSALLQLEGYRPITVRDGAAALAQVAQMPPQTPFIIMADHQLPGGMDGIETINQIRRSLLRQIPALLLGSREPDFSSARDGCAACLFVAKPLKPASLLAAVETAVRLALPSWRAEARPKQQISVTPPTATSPDSDIAIIDDDAGIRDAVCAILEPGGYKVERFASAEAYLADPQHLRFKCLLVDIALPGMSGMELQGQLTAFEERPQIIFLSGNTDLPVAVKALQNGAADFLRKPVQGTVLLQSVANVLRNGREPAAERLPQADLALRLRRLSKREHEVMERVVRGELNKNIAADLGISERTIEHHRQNVMRKMGVKSLAMLVRMMTSS